MTTVISTPQQAEKCVSERLARLRPELQVLEGSTRKDRGIWLVSVNSPDYARSRDMRDMLLGLGPVLVDAVTGEMFSSGSGYSAERWVDRYLSKDLAGLIRLE